MAKILHCENPHMMRVKLTESILNTKWYFITMDKKIEDSSSKGKAKLAMPIRYTNIDSDFEKCAKEYPCTTKKPEDESTEQAEGVIEKTVLNNQGKRKYLVPQHKFICVSFGENNKALPKKKYQAIDIMEKCLDQRPKSNEVKKPYLNAREHKKQISSQQAFNFGIVEALKPRGGYGTWISDAVESFTKKIEKQMQTTENKNYIYSPISLYNLLISLYAGTNRKAESFDQLWGALGYPTSDITKMIKKSKTYNEKLKMRLKQYIYSKEDKQLAEKFKKQMEDMEYIITPKKQFIEKEVNDQVAADTDNMIKELFGPGSFDAATELVVFNTIYFNEKWALPFDKKRTADRDFLTKRTPFMFWTGKQKLRMAPKREAFINNAPFNGRVFIQLDFKPSEGSEDSQGEMITFITGNLFEGAYNASTMDTSGFDFSDVQLSDIKKVFNNKVAKGKRLYSERPTDFGMPKFKYDYDMKIKKILQDIGVTDIFSRGNAKLDNMFKDGASGIYVDQMVHKAAVEVDEAGAKAAAASGYTLTSRSMSYPLLLNLPFKYIIHDRDYEIPYFVGNVRCPAGGAIEDCL